MKSGLLTIAGAAVVLVGGIAFAFLRDAPPDPVPQTTAAPTVLAAVGADEAETDAAADPAAPPPSVHVDELAAEPERFTGRVTIRGVVAGVNQDQKAVALIDSREFEECGTVACATSYLPVRVSGTLPEPLSLVQVVGEVTNGTDGLEVLAESLEIVE